MARSTVRIEGLKELDRALGELPKATAKATLRKVLREEAQPLARAMRDRAPKEEGYLYESIDVSTKLSRRQAGLHKKENRRTFAEMFVGTNNPAGVQQEFGNERHPPQPFARPAWDAEQKPLLERIGNRLGYEIVRAAERLAKRGR